MKEEEKREGKKYNGPLKKNVLQLFLVSQLEWVWLDICYRPYKFVAYPSGLVFT
jgi:hypothetical protein